jgi:hypothetical protein
MEGDRLEFRFLWNAAEHRRLGQGIVDLLMGAVPALAICLLTATSERVWAQGDRTWRTVVTPDSALRFQLPGDYHARNAYGCGSRNHRQQDRPGWRDLCVSMADSEESRHVHLIDLQGSHYSDARGCAADCMRYEKVKADTVEIGGRHAVVERGRASGASKGWSGVE